MSQHDMNIANQGFPAFRSDLNNALAALVSNSSSATEPTTTFAYQFWADTANDLLKQRNAANDGWVSILTLSTGAPVGITADKIEEGNSKVEVIDSGTGYIQVVVDGIETARVAPNGLGVGVTTPASAVGRSVDASGPLLAGGYIASHQTSKGVFEHQLDNTKIRSYGSAAGSGYITLNVGGGGGSTDTEAVRVDASSNLKFNSGYGSVATAYGCRAWVNFNGTGTVAIRDSGNVSSITDLSTGSFEVNFTTSMPDVNYSQIANCGVGSGSGNYGYSTIFYTPATTKCGIRTVNQASSQEDFSHVSLAVFR